MGIKLLCKTQYRSVRNRPIVNLNTLGGGPGGPVSLNIKPRRNRYEQESTKKKFKMAITFSSRGSSRYLRALGEAPRCIFSPQIDRIWELPRQEKDISFQSSIYYVKLTKLRIHCKNGKL